MFKDLSTWFMNDPFANVKSCFEYHHVIVFRFPKLCLEFCSTLYCVLFCQNDLIQISYYVVTHRDLSINFVHIVSHLSQQ